MREQKESLSVQNSIQTRLSAAMVLVMIFVVCINFFIFEQIHMGVDRIDAVFSSNTAINDLSESLNKLEGTVYEYLNTKGSKALENYYRYEQDYRQLLDGLNDRNVDSEVKMLEKNIRKMSVSAGSKVKANQQVLLLTEDFDAVPDMYGWTKKNADIFGEWTGIEITYKGSGKKVTKQSVKMNTSLNKTKKITLTLGD